MSWIWQFYDPFQPTFLFHPNCWWNRAGLAHPRSVEGPHSEAVLVIRLEPGAHYVRSALTLVSELNPVLSTSLVIHLNHITHYGTAAVVTRARPGQHQTRLRQEGDHRARSRGLRSLWWGDTFLGDFRKLLHFCLPVGHNMLDLTNDSKGKCVLSWAFAVLQHHSVATRVLRFSICNN